MDTKDLKEQFYREKEACTTPLTHIMEDIAPGFAEIDELYGAADVLSIQNAERHRRVLLALSAAGTLLALVFLIYDTIDIRGMILGCGVMLLFLFLIHRYADRLDCHRKYLQYRVLAESLRVQFFLLHAGLTTRVAKILPWPTKKGIPWIHEILSQLSITGQGEKHSVLDCWIRDQRQYHESALLNAEHKNKKDSHLARAVLIVTIVAYCFAVLYELAAFQGIGMGTHDEIRVVCKIVLGTMSAVTIFTGSYYGKMSLSNVIEDHKRMAELYRTAEEEISHHGENEEQLLFLAREFLNENSTWYAYQSKNKPDLVI